MSKLQFKIEYSSFSGRNNLAENNPVWTNGSNMEAFLGRDDEGEHWCHWHKKCRFYFHASCRAHSGKVLSVIQRKKIPTQPPPPPNWSDLSHGNLVANVDRPHLGPIVHHTLEWSRAGRKRTKFPLQRHVGLSMPYFLSGSHPLTLKSYTQCLVV